MFVLGIALMVNAFPPVLITDAEVTGCPSHIIDFLTGTSSVSHCRIKIFDVANEFAGLRRDIWQEYELVSRTRVAVAKR